MGAHQSVPGAGDEPPASAAKTCYYELLGVDRDATDVEIKKAYRKRALELHPDRNLSDAQEEATRKFAEVQSAYEVLSDPQERAWYDSHRDAILAGTDDLGNNVEPTSFRNVRLTTTEEIFALIRQFNAAIPFNDDAAGFFGVCRETFEHLALEEDTAAEMNQTDFPDYPTFGFSDDEYETVVKRFYASWIGFSTKKSFSWKDKYRLSDAPDRRVRRLMEKDNKKCRDDGIREFNDAVRFLVTFVRKRDPRYRPNSQTDTERQKHLRDAAAAQAARSRAANRQKLQTYEVPDWPRPQEDHAQDEYFSEIEEDSEVEILECVVCNKAFKSAPQLEAHERSKKHTKAIQQLRKRMRKEGIDFELDNVSIQETDQHQQSSTPDPTGSVNAPSIELDTLHIAEDGPSLCQSADEAPDVRDQVELSDSPSDPDVDEYAPRGEVEGRLGRSVTDSQVAGRFGESEDFLAPSALSDSPGESTMPAQNKIGKAKAKRQKKAARQLSEAETQQRCSVCHKTFPSRSKLFDHIRSENHAAVKRG